MGRQRTASAKPAPSAFDPLGSGEKKRARDAARRVIARHARRAKLGLDRLTNSAALCPPPGRGMLVGKRGSPVRLWNVREWKIVTLRFLCGYTLQEVAQLLGMTRERVRQIENRVIRRMPLVQAIGDATRCDVVELQLGKPPSGQEHWAITEIPIKLLPVPSRIHRLVTRFGIQTVGDLIQHTAKELLACPQFHTGSLETLRAFLASVDLKLRDD